MGKDKKVQKNETHIGSVIGQVSTGSGDTNISSMNFSFGQRDVNTREEFLGALRDFKEELDAAQREGLPADATQIAIREVKAAEEEAQKEEPKPKEIADRMKKAKEALVLVSGSAAATGAVIATADKLITLAERLAEIAGRLF